MMFRTLIILCLIMNCPPWVKSQSGPVSFKQLELLQADQPRPVVVLIMTNWCKYCHAMKNALLRNKEVADLLNKNYYLVFLNAEDNKDIVYLGRRFKFKPTGPKTGVHELAEQLGTINGTLSYPSLCILNADNEITFQHEGYLDAKALSVLLGRASQ